MANGTIAASQLEMLSLSGTGIITITPPATNTNRAITLPDAAGALVVSGTTPSLNGITFPATQVPSADANTLDDYEEGTWTPGIGTLTQVGGTFTSSGTYTKIGRSVTVTGRIDISGGTVAASTSANLSGLPFTVGSISCMGGGTNATLTASFTSDAEAGTTGIYFPSVAATAGLKFSVTYFV